MLARAEATFHWLPDPALPALSETPQGPLRVGVDLGTAYVVMAVLDVDGMPVAGEYQFAQVARDGLVVDFVGAVDIVRSMKQRLEDRIGRELTHAASGYPPGVPQAEVRATANAVEGAGLACTGLIDEPSAANEVLGLKNGVVVDVGGGTTGVAVLQDGEVVYTADEATGGTHFSLVIAGAHDVPFEQAEAMKKDPEQQQALFPVVRPVMEKVASIVARHIADFDVDSITLVGGSVAFPGFDEAVAQYTGLPAYVPERPVFVTPLGIARHNQPENI
ncbi:MAG: ethanolamine utilization protein EutJ [Chloroflexi bacterium]|nr:MAG: ethanolamine utilization protein EutJ [Chloroflexota bacterium]MBL1197148.1 ethanolamine utilization protein EutJ [Chloroflexota bacterium]NOH14443.1 ethanolamine utilization protein EutJ [Chloroflexota bacterium]